MASEGEEILILEATPYKIVDEKTGELNTGLSIKYTYGESVQSESRRGLVSYDDSLPYEALNDLRVVPGFYVTMEAPKPVKNARGKTQRVMKIVGLRFVCAMSIMRVGADGKPAPANGVAPAREGAPAGR